MNVVVLVWLLSRTLVNGMTRIVTNSRDMFVSKVPCYSLGTGILLPAELGFFSSPRPDSRVHPTCSADLGGSLSGVKQ